MEGGLVLAGLGGAVLGAWLVRRWTKSGKAPETALKCLNCPKLLESKRRWMVLAAGLGLLEVVTLGWWSWSVTQH